MGHESRSTDKIGHLPEYALARNPQDPSALCLVWLRVVRPTSDSELRA